MKSLKPVGVNDFLMYLGVVTKHDVEELESAQKSYGDSWKKRGGTGAFMMLARKWDRIENFLGNLAKRAQANNQVNADGSPISNHDIFAAILMDTRREGIIDDIRDLRRYLILVEAHMLATGGVEMPVPKEVSKTPAAASTHTAPLWRTEHEDGRVTCSFCVGEMRVGERRPFPHMPNCMVLTQKRDAVVDGGSQHAES